MIWPYSDREYQNHQGLVLRNLVTIVSALHPKKTGWYYLCTSLLSSVIQKRFRSLERPRWKTVCRKENDAITVRVSHLLLRHQVWVNLNLVIVFHFVSSIERSSWTLVITNSDMGIIWYCHLNNKRAALNPSRERTSNMFGSKRQRNVQRLVRVFFGWS